MAFPSESLFKKSHKVLLISQANHIPASHAEETGEWLRWPVQPPGLVLEESTVHVWSFSLQISSLERHGLERILSVDEQERAASLNNHEVRDRFITARARLRQMLGQFLGSAPRDILFEYGAQGKPALVAERDQPPLMFNLAHSGDVGLIAIGVNRQVGIDHEKKKRVADDIGIAERFFSPTESRYIRSLPSSQRGEEFLKIWTCKEAYIKATGMGLSCSLDSFEVVFSSESRRGGIINIGESERRIEYTIHLLPPCSKFLGAVVSAGQNWKLKYWQWPDIPSS